MYHAFFDDNAPLKCADSHYATSFYEFEKHIQLCIDKKYKITSIKAILNEPNNLNDKKCCFTFDDGHLTNYSAAKLLHKYNFTGDFFINSSNIGKKHFLNKDQIMDMSKMGMSIQSHSHSHVYLEDLSCEDAKYQLEKSKEIISSILDKEVTIYCPPGGRISRENISQAIDAGYLAVTNSRPGIWRNINNTHDIPRLVIFNKTTISDFEKLLMCDRASLMLIGAKYRVTRFAKIILGNVLYDVTRMAFFKLAKFISIIK